MVTAGDQTCEVTEVPKGINAAAIQDTGKEVSNRTPNVTFTKDEERVQNELKISTGSLTTEETGRLTESMKKVCDGKEIEKIAIQATDKDTFENIANGAIVAIDVPRPTGRRKRDECSDIKVHCKFARIRRMFKSIDFVHF